MEASSIEILKSHEPALREYAKGLYEMYDAVEHGDDWWTSYQFPDGSYADINICLLVHDWDETDTNVRVEIQIDAYPVSSTGDLVTETWLTIFKKTISPNKGNN